MFSQTTGSAQQSLLYSISKVQMIWTTIAPGTSVISEETKIIERGTYDHWYAYLSQHNMTPKGQPRFRSIHSTVTVLLVTISLAFNILTLCSFFLLSPSFFFALALVFARPKHRSLRRNPTETLATQARFTRHHPQSDFFVTHLEKWAHRTKQKEMKGEKVNEALISTTLVSTFRKKAFL